MEDLEKEISELKYEQETYRQTRSENGHKVKTLEDQLTVLSSQVCMGLLKKLDWFYNLVENNLNFYSLLSFAVSVLYNIYVTWCTGIQYLYYIIYRLPGVQVYSICTI